MIQFGQKSAPLSDRILLSPFLKLLLLFPLYEERVLSLKIGAFLMKGEREETRNESG